MAIKFKIVNEDRTSLIVSRDSKFSLEYLEDKITHAIPGSIGIAVFDTKANADFYCPNYDGTKVLEVKPIGRGKKLKRIAGISDMHTGLMCTKIIEAFMSKDLSLPEKTGYFSAPPRGSIFYPAVKVLN